MYAYEGSEYAELKIILKNNGKLKWTGDAKLIKTDDSQNLCNDVKLNPIDVNEQESVTISFDKIKNLTNKTYVVNFAFVVDGKSFGPILRTELIIKKM